MALAASLISIRVGISVALIEIVVGALAGNLPWLSSHVEQTAFTAFLATIGSVLLTFLAGAASWRLCGLLLAPGLDSACRGDRRGGAQHHLGRRSVRGHGRDRTEPGGHRQAHPRRLLC